MLDQRLFRFGNAPAQAHTETSAFDAKDDES